MACSYSYITNNVSNPVEADRLNNLHTSIMQDAVDSKLFKRKDKLYFSSLGTKKLQLQLDYVDKTNTIYNSEVLSKSDENTLKVNVLGLVQDVVEPVEETKPQIEESELNTKLKSFINTQGFEAKVITDLERHQEANGKTFTVNGWVDLTNKIIKYDEQSLPEEAFTLARAMFVPDNSTIYEQVRQHPLYEQVKKDYKSIYKNELEFAKETLDKLGAENIIRKANTVDGRLMTRLKRIWEKLMSWIKGNNELESFLNEMTDAILNNKVVGSKNEDVTGTFYQIDSSKFKESTILNNFKSELEDVVRAKTARMKIYAAKAVKSFGKREGKRIAELNRDLSNDKVTLGIVSFLNQTEEEAIGIVAKLNTLLTKYDVLTTKEKATLLNNIMGFLEAYKQPLLNIQSDINLFGIDSKYDDIKPTLSKIIENINNIETQYKRIGTVLFAETLWPFASKNPEIKNVDNLISKLQSQEDIGFYRRMFNSMADSTDDVLASIDQMVKEKKEKARYISDRKIKQLLVAQKELEDGGIKDTEWMVEEGSRNFVTRYRRDEYNKLLNEMREKLRSKYSLPEKKFQREQFLNVFNDFQVKKWISENEDWLQPTIDKIKKKNRGIPDTNLRELVWKEVTKQYRMDWALFHEENSQEIDNLEEVVMANLEEFYKSQVFENEARDEAIGDIFNVVYRGQKGKVILTSDEVKAKELFEEWLNDRRRTTKKGRFYYVYELSQPSDKFLNKKFVEIQTNPLKKRYYDLVMELKEEADYQLPQERINTYQIPQMRKDWIERIKGGGVSKLKESVKDTFVIRESDTEFGELTRDEDGNIVEYTLADEKGNPVNFLPIYYTNPIEDINDMSKDITSIMASYVAMAEDYGKMNEVVDILELGNEILSQRKVEVGNNILGKSIELFTGAKVVSQQTGGLAYQRFTDYMQMVVYGKQKEKESNRLFEYLGLDQAKVVDAFNKYTAIQGLGFNVFSGINNVVLGNALSRQEAFAGEYATHKDFLNADKTYWSELPGVLSDVGNNLSKNKLRLFEETLDVFQDYKQRLNELETDRSRFGRLFNTSAIFVLQQLGEHQIQLRTALAIAHNTKVKVDGVETTVWDALEVDGYNLNIKKGTKKLDGTDFTQDDLIQMSLKIRGLNNRLYGIYNEVDKSAIQKWSLGRMLMLFRKFIVPGWNRRWEGKRFDYDSNMQVEGYYRTSGKFLLKLFQEMRAGELSIKANWNNLSEMEKANVIRTFVDIAYVSIAIVLVGILGNLADDDDENWALNVAALSANRFYTDMRFYSSPSEFIRLMKSPAAGLNQITTITNFSKSIDPFGYLFDDDPFIRVYNSGKNEGETYFWNSVQKTVPLYNQLEKAFYPDEQLIFYSK